MADFKAAYAIKINAKMVNKPILMTIFLGIPWTVKVGSYLFHDRRNLSDIETAHFLLEDFFSNY